MQWRHTIAVLPQQKLLCSLQWSVGGQQPIKPSSASETPWLKFVGHKSAYLIHLTDTPDAPWRYQASYFNLIFFFHSAASEVLFEALSSYKNVNIIIFSSLKHCCNYCKFMKYKQKNPKQTGLLFQIWRFSNHLSSRATSISPLFLLLVCPLSWIK